MLILLTVLLTVAGVITAAVFPLMSWVAAGVCWAVFLLLAGALIGDHGRSASLRHAVLGAVAFAAIVSMVVAVITVGDLPLEVRETIRTAIVAVGTAPPTYWLLLLISGGFRQEPG